MRSCDLAGGAPGETLSVYKARPKTFSDMGLGSELRTKNVLKSGLGFAAFCSAAVSCLT